MRCTSKETEQRLRGLFAAHFGETSGPFVLASAPGRVELAGNHTDHQGGRTLSAAIGQRAHALAAPNGSDAIRVFMDGFGEGVVRLAELDARARERGGSLALVRGMAAAYAQAGGELRGFDMVTCSDIPVGCGVSSSAEIVDWVDNAQKGERLARLSTTLPSLDEALHAVGHTPLPPYIKDYAGDEELYQTVYARRESSAAAPTAGLHFTPELIEHLRTQGVGWETVELEVGLDTFRIVDEDDPTQHVIHTEYYTVPQRTADAIAETRERGGRVVAVGTTSVRSLESAWDAEAAAVTPRERETTSLYLLPGSEFHVVDALVTNFHVPRSTLMMLVSAFSSREHIMAAYAHAIEERYRMLSFGDAMFIC